MGGHTLKEGVADDLDQLVGVEAVGSLLVKNSDHLLYVFIIKTNPGSQSGEFCNYKTLLLLSESLFLKRSLNLSHIF